jgi:hypothetical protein
VSPKPAPAGGAAVDALLDPTFLENATRAPMTEVRLLRRQAEQEEVNLSYTRRLLQGRLDIVLRELQRLTPGVDLPAIADLSDAKLEKAARALAEAESGLSERRRGVQQVMDALAAELGRRYRDGEADVAALLADEGRH